MSFLSAKPMLVQRLLLQLYQQLTQPSLSTTTDHCYFVWCCRCCWLWCCWHLFLLLLWTMPPHLHLPAFEAARPQRIYRVPCRVPVETIRARRPHDFPSVPIVHSHHCFATIPPLCHVCSSHRCPF